MYVDHTFFCTKIVQKHDLSTGYIKRVQKHSMRFINLGTKLMKDADWFPTRSRMDLYLLLNWFLILWIRVLSKEYARPHGVWPKVLWHWIPATLRETLHVEKITKTTGWQKDGQILDFKILPRSLDNRGFWRNKCSWKMTFSTFRSMVWLDVLRFHTILFSADCSLRRRNRVCKETLQSFSFSAENLLHIKLKGYRVNNIWLL